MFSINIRVACSVFVIFTVSLSARAFSASARAFFNALRMVTIETMAPNRLPPKTTLRISLSSMSFLLIDSYFIKPFSHVKTRTGLCCYLAVTDNLHLRETTVEVQNVLLQSRLLS